jgi:hypothetical protein
MGVTRGVGTAAGAAAAVLLGCWVTGGVLTDDAAAAMALTGLWFATAVVLALVAVRRWGRAAWPGLAATVLTSSLVGGGLLLASRVDRVVDEQVLADPMATTALASVPASPGPRAVTRIATGSFASGAHETRGKATLLRRTDGRLVLTLVDFATAAGPDLRVRLVSAGARGVDGAADIGALKGNKGDQQYVVPAGAPTARVVIWCRAFSVNFGSADLRR